MNKRIITGLTSAAMLLGCAAPLSNSGIAFSQVITAQAETVTMKYPEQAAKLRESMKACEEVISVDVVLKSIPDDPYEIMKEIFNEAVSHTGEAMEGDWLYYHLISTQYWGSYTYNKDRTVTMTCYFGIGYNTTAEQQAAADEKADRIIEYLDLDGKSDRDKIFAIYNYVCQNVEYDHENAYDDSNVKKYSGYAALCERKAVCQGYALAVYDLMLKAGIDCRVVTGKLNGGNHAWNIVRLNGKYYYLDATNDSYKQTYRYLNYNNEYKYFLKTAGSMPSHSTDSSFLTSPFTDNYTYASSNYESATSAEKWTDGDFEYYPSLDKTVITAYKGSGQNVVVPAEINGCPVEGIVKDTFSENSTVKTIEISEGVKTIGGLFAGDCQNLKEIHLPSTADLFATDYKGFSGLVTGCSQLTTITVAGKSPYLRVSDGILYNAAKTKVICMPAALNKTKVVIPKGVTTVNDECFRESKYLEEVKLPDTLTDIGYLSFGVCLSLKKITIPASVTSIDDYAFYYCTGLKDIYYSGTQAQWAAISVGSGNESLKRATVHYVQPYTPPTLSYEKGDGSVKLSWNAVYDAEKYGIAGFVDGEWQLLDKTTDTTYTLKNLKAGTEYKVAVVTMLDGEWEMDVSNAITVTPNEAAVSLYPVVQTQVKDNKIGFKWSKVPGAEKYGIGVYQANKWVVKKQVDGSVTTWTSPQVGAGTYRLVVLAKVNGQWVNADVFKKSFYVTVK
ncbi:leucine-rich repeat protein [uncultured Ruminococcus sp.]|uniref:leucine-rich repeat protein n=1 Tax=uncultured Ruminococcus sp. TaxID=165186 RepID=UPI0025F9FC56|nr:leucine-rich repeat protein [uncultured Ruminococcus sp.]